MPATGAPIEIVRILVKERRLQKRISANPSSRERIEISGSTSSKVHLLGGNHGATGRGGTSSTLSTAGARQAKCRHQHQAGVQMFQEAPQTGLARAGGGDEKMRGDFGTNTRAEAQNRSDQTCDYCCSVRERKRDLTKALAGAARKKHVRRTGAGHVGARLEHDVPPSGGGEMERTVRSRILGGRSDVLLLHCEARGTRDGCHQEAESAQQ